MRLTWRRADGAVCPRVEKGTDIHYIAGEFTQKVYDKLCEYEDAEEQGLLARLTQKTVYVIGWGEGKDCNHICPAKIDGVGCCSLCDNGELIIYEEECHQEHLPHIGKTVFLTCEEAEAALKGGHDDGTA